MKKKLSFGWVISITGGINGFVSSGPTFFASSTIFRAIEDEFGWSRTLVSGVASFGRFGGALFGPFEGWLIDKFSVGKMVFLGFIIAGFGLILFSIIKSPMQYYISFFLISLGFSIGGFTPSITAVNSWMINKKATAMSIVIGGSTLGGLSAPLLVWGMGNMGWRPTMLIFGLITLILGPITAVILNKKPPKFKNLPTENLLKILPKDFTTKEALKNSSFWTLSASHMLVNASLAAIMAHIYLYLTDPNGHNISPEIASTILPIMAIFSLVFQVIGGILGDISNKRLLASLFISIQGISVLILTLSSGFNSIILFAIIWGIGYGGRTPLIHAMRGEYFGRKHFATITGFSSMGVGISMMTTPILVGRYYDVYKSYDNAFIIVSILCFVSSILILFARNPNKKIKKIF